MSSFTNYESKAATDYDVTRIPVGIEIYEGAIRKYAPERDFTKVKVLDLGAGTGSYDKLLLDSGIGHITCADVSETMMAKCKTKIEKSGHSERVGYLKTVLPKIEAPDNTFDVVTISMVIHHLVKLDDNGKVSDWSPIVNTFREAKRVLKPKGVLIIGYSTPEQRGGNWYAHLVPKTRLKTIARCPSGLQVLDFCKLAGFDVQSDYSLMTHYTGYKVYNDPEVFIKNPGAWSMDSVISSASEAEMHEAKNLVLELHKNSELQAFKEQHDSIPIYGCGRIVTAIASE